MNKFAPEYVDVATRIAMFREKHPEGSLQPHDPYQPIRVVTVGEKTFLEYVAVAYRSPDDLRPGIAIAWEPFPGRTPYTRDSEAMVVETSAFGRAIVAVLAADTRKGVASAEEVRNRQAERAEPITEADQIRAEIRRQAEYDGYSLQTIADDFEKRTHTNIRDAGDTPLAAYLGQLRSHAITPGAAGTPTLRAAPEEAPE